MKRGTRILIISVVFAFAVNIAIQALLMSAGLDIGGYYASWNGGSAAAIEDLHGRLIASGGFSFYGAGHFLDYAFQAGLLAASLSAVVLMTRRLRASQSVKNRLLWLCVLPCALYIADVVETSLIVSTFHDPLHVSRATAAAHPTAFAAMMVFLALEAAALLSLGAVLIVGRAAAKAGGAKEAGRP